MRTIVTGMLLITSSLLFPLQAGAMVLQQFISPPETIPVGYNARPVYASASHREFLFAYNSDYVEEAQADLMRQCSGRLMGVSVTYSREPSFLTFHNVVHMHALCVEAAAATSPATN